MTGVGREWLQMFLDRDRPGPRSATTVRRGKKSCADSGASHLRRNHPAAPCPPARSCSRHPCTACRLWRASGPRSYGISSSKTPNVFGFVSISAATSPVICAVSDAMSTMPLGVRLQSFLLDSRTWPRSRGFVAVCGIRISTLRRFSFLVIKGTSARTKASL